MVRQCDVPTALRTSALSLLATCVDTYALAMLPYVVDLSRAMVDLLQTEVVAAQAEDVRRKLAASTRVDAGASDKTEDKGGDLGTSDNPGIQENWNRGPSHRSIPT